VMVPAHQDQRYKPGQQKQRPQHCAIPPRWMAGGI